MNHTTAQGHTQWSPPVRKQPRTEKFFMRLSKYEQALLFRLAARRDMSASAVMRQALRRLATEVMEGGR